jgi:osmotically-inducible protein OsmY
MAWLQRLFGLEKPPAAQAAPATAPAAADGTPVPPERVGLHGEYDDSGLAKRVALAFDQDASIDDIDTLYVAQTGTTVVLKGKVPNQESLSKMVSTARGVSGAAAVDTSQVTVG